MPRSLCNSALARARRGEAGRLSAGGDVVQWRDGCIVAVVEDGEREAGVNWQQHVERELAGLGSCF